MSKESIHSEHEEPPHDLLSGVMTYWMDLTDGLFAPDPSESVDDEDSSCSACEEAHLAELSAIAENHANDRLLYNHRWI